MAGAPRPAAPRASRPARPAPSRSASVGRHPLRGLQQPGGVLPADQQRQQVRRRGLGRDAERGERALEPRLGGHEGQVGEAEDRAADAEADAVDRDDQRLRERVQRVDEPREAVPAALERRVGGDPVHLEQVGAGREAAAVAGQQHHRDRRVLGRRRSARRRARRTAPR